jgi:two-component system nitrate/nitrite response regulator NarL
MTEEDSRTAGPRTIIVDDHPIYREGLANILRTRHGLDVVAIVANAKDALARIRALRPEVAILDLRLPDLSGMDVLKALETENSTTRVVVLSAFGDNATVYDAFSHGARAFLLKSSSAAEIASTVLAVARGESVISEYFQTGLVQEIHARRRQTERPILSARETEVLRLASEGRSALQIAADLNLSVATVKTHLQRIYERLEVSDRASAVAAAMRRGLLD